MLLQLPYGGRYKIDLFLDDARFFYSQIQSYCNLFEKDEGVNATKLPIYLETNGSGEVRYRIKEGWRLHMYISQLPCKYKYTLFLSSLVVYWCVKNSLLTVLTVTWGLDYFFPYRWGCFT